jgi:hypothetical protein
MPYHIRHMSHGDGKPWKIIDSFGRVVGSSTSKKKAEASIRARYMGEHKEGK